ncbi:IPT/TIG domain-containing protein [Streptomyces melanosporofaciens]|uniref:IPT/TIG domain-containing protein n=1 Tax=Streptomyces melanosporofaciens TaxID=67327 RepID=UPI000B89357C|nr:IPT/TIG domain-containing protein [Streptomyces melanosporofaciens]
MRQHTTPIAGCTDTVDVTVTSLGGTSVPMGSGWAYTFYDAPNADSVTPAAQLSGQNVTIGGTCLLDATAVVLGDGLTQTPPPCEPLPTQILAVVPVVLPGAYSVLVTTPGGTDTTASPSLLVL